MAEALDLLFDLCRFFEANGGQEELAGTRSRSSVVHQIQLGLLAIGFPTAVTIAMYGSNPTSEGDD